MMQTEPILLVEDNKVNQMIAEAMLRKLGVTVEIATNGEEAITKITQDQKNYALVLMDCQMPVVDGFTATRTIRAWEEQNPNITQTRVPIIAMTAHALESSRVSCLECGMDDYVNKPITLANLSELLNKWQVL
jgi:two-component system, sensor histidine kinase